MKIKLIIYISIILSTLFIKESSAQGKKNDFFTDSTWNTLSPLALSPDGQWAVIGNKYNKNSRINKLFFINTKTKKTKDLTHFSNFFETIFNNGLIVGKINDKLAIYSLNQKDSLLINDKITSFSTNTKENLLFYLKNNSEFTITKLSENLKKLKTELSLQAIDKYYLSPNSNKLVVVTKKKELIQINLKDFTLNKITDLKDNIKTLKWNINQDGFVIHIDNKLHVIDLNSNKIGVIDITEDKDIENLKLSFFLNNDLFVSYQFNSDKMIPESQYLDIWQGNSRQLLPSDFKPKYKKIYKAFVYKNKQDTITSLERKIDKDYLNIGIPGYLLSYNYFKNLDFNNNTPPIEYSLHDIDKQKNVTSLSMTFQSPFYPSVDGKHILYPINQTKVKWEILNIKTLQRHSFKIDKSSHLDFTPIWSQDSETIFYSFEGNLFSYNLENKKTTKLTRFTKKDDSSIQRLINKNNIPSYTYYIDTNKPFYFTVAQNQKKTIYAYEKQKAKAIYSTTKNLQLSLSQKNTSKADSNTLFSIEDYNLPPTILCIKDTKVSTLMESDINKDLYKWRKRVDFTFTDKFNKELHGYLFYPKNYDPTKKYPMVVQIYDLRLHPPYNEFSIPVHVASNSGFNSSLLTENEYFVLRAQTYVTEEGPGVSAVDCVTNAVNKSMEIEPTIDKDNLGLIGYSFGGYKTSAVSVLTDIFKASVSGSGAHDFIGNFMFRYSYYRKMPDWFIAERAQSNMGVKFSEDPQKYYNNSPILNAYKTKTAMLLFTGLQDNNVDWENTRRMFVALKREQKPVIALFYNNINHGFTNQTPTETNDLSKRVLDWFDYHLKNKKNIPWIKNGLDYKKYSISPL
ncbi:alpha/beta hydrolase family protein [Myroides odoratimimus]|uniref:alpha/beta hydrolase family protein n=1 Tax=Myroides odoratimimus TaxID=76832 RepID=UPI002DBD37F5|nr:prolyl oligopeptidase family serine peptidase [Myroides odoratimimus]MEC4043654.1 prolyl oligopeptidase family serine peptidase [Myroides odoratimimus]MEC4151490.1 prolyl oligopeptidase family serine peptidase [Myroides odoratimimus]